MKRPRPVSRAASSTRAIDWPTQRRAALLSAIAGRAACGIRRLASQSRSIEVWEECFQQGARVDHTLGSRDLPIRLILHIAEQHQLARRDTCRNSLGETPALL